MYLNLLEEQSDSPFLLMNRWINKVLWTPSRKYDQASNTVGKEYDAWESVSTEPKHVTFNVFYHINYILCIGGHSGTLLGRAYPFGRLRVRVTTPR